MTQHATPRTGVRGEGNLQEYWDYLRVNWKHAGQALDMPATLGWYTNLVLTGFSVRAKEGGWLAIIKADGRRMPLIAFCDGISFDAACIRTVAEITRGGLRWKEDVWPTKASAWWYSYKDGAKL